MQLLMCMRKLLCGCVDVWCVCACVCAYIYMCVCACVCVCGGGEWGGGGAHTLTCAAPSQVYLYSFQSISFVYNCYTSRTYTHCATIVCSSAGHFYIKFNVIVLCGYAHILHMSTIIPLCIICTGTPCMASFCSPIALPQRSSICGAIG